MRPTRNLNGVPFRIVGIYPNNRHNRGRGIRSGRVTWRMGHGGYHIWWPLVRKEKIERVWLEYGAFRTYLTIE
jgi:hypothetical protein